MKLHNSPFKCILAFDYNGLSQKKVFLLRIINQLFKWGNKNKYEKRASINLESRKKVLLLHPLLEKGA